MAISENCQNLQLQGIIGFNGTVCGGLQYTPCGKYSIYPLGSMIVVKNIATSKQSFLEGHVNKISCVCVSKDGSKLATGEFAIAGGTKADIILWDLSMAKNNCDNGNPMEGGEIIFRKKQHLGKVQALDFSCDDKYLATLGGQDDNSVVVWEVASGRAVMGSPAAQDQTLAVKWLNQRNDRFVTCGYYNLRVWQTDVSIPKIHAMNAKMGNVRRLIQCISITPDDKFAYCGTKTGDVMRFRIDRDPIQGFNDPDITCPSFDAISKERFGKGVKSVQCVYNEKSGRVNALIGSGDGKICLINSSMNVVYGMNTEVMGSATSISVHPNGKSFLVGTDQSNRYFVTMDFDMELRSTCHYGRINKVAFPAKCSDLFITCSINDIRVWNSKMEQELLRIQVPGLESKCIGITPNGGTIVSGWNDGKIRAFYPESGRLKFVITDAHMESCTAIAVCNDDENSPPWRIVSGGLDGRVRIWNVTSSHQRMAYSAKEHRAAVNDIAILKDNSQFISASADGSCIVWDMKHMHRLNAFFEPTVFKCVIYHPDESQILTCGSNFKIAYWDAYDGSAIRVVEGGSAEMTTMDIVPDGELFVSGGADKNVKLWHYDDGMVVALGRGHSGTVNCVKFSPDLKKIVSVGEEGGVYIWNFPTQKISSLSDNAVSAVGAT